MKGASSSFTLTTWKDMVLMLMLMLSGRTCKNSVPVLITITFQFGEQLCTCALSTFMIQLCHTVYTSQLPSYAAKRQRKQILKMDHLTEKTKITNYDDYPFMDQLTGEVDLEEIQELRDKQMTYAQIEELLQEQKAREDEAEAEEYQKAFSLLDKDKDGNITVEQLAAVMR